MKPLIRTFTGRMVNPLDLKIGDINILDIAHHLSLVNRFNGATRFPINVAYHSYWVARLAYVETNDPKVALQGLLHDATEAYLGDVTKWLKHSPAMNGYREAEDRAQKIIMERYGLPYREWSAVQKADRMMVTYEGRIGFNSSTWPDLPDRYPDLPKDVLDFLNECWTTISWWEAKKLMLDYFECLEKMIVEQGA